MISADQVMIIVQPVDMRLGIDGLTSLVQQALGSSACDGRVYLFRNRAGNRLKPCVGMEMVCGCASAVCIKASFIGHNQRHQYGVNCTSIRRLGYGIRVAAH